MNILALDTSSQAASCALLRDGILVGEFFIHVALTHSQTTLPMVRAMLDSTGTVLDEVDVYAVSTGPGSFTGLRIGISTVKGMAMAGKKPCAPISTLEGLAWNVLPFSGLVVPVMDARREQVYTAAFRCGEDAPKRLWEDTALAIDELGEKLKESGKEPILLLGDGAQLCYERLKDTLALRLAPAHLLHQRASSLALAAASKPDNHCAAEALMPSYLRIPQAERERLAKLR